MWKLFPARTKMDRVILGFLPNFGGGGVGGVGGGVGGGGGGGGKTNEPPLQFSDLLQVFQLLLQFCNPHLHGSIL